MICIGAGSLFFTRVDLMILTHICCFSCFLRRSVSFMQVLELNDMLCLCVWYSWNAKEELSGERQPRHIGQQNLDQVLVVDSITPSGKQSSTIPCTYHPMSRYSTLFFTVLLISSAHATSWIPSLSLQEPTQECGLYHGKCTSCISVGCWYCASTNQCLLRSSDASIDGALKPNTCSRTVISTGDCNFHADSNTHLITHMSTDLVSTVRDWASAHVLWTIAIIIGASLLSFCFIICCFTCLIKKLLCWPCSICC